MELYDLKTFITVAEEGHLTRAAQRLNTSQPAVSAHIKGLEAELGIMLFTRTPKGMRLTQEGEALKDQAARALSIIDTLRDRAGALKDEVRGTLDLNFVYHRRREKEAVIGAAVEAVQAVWGIRMRGQGFEESRGRGGTPTGEIRQAPNVKQTTKNQIANSKSIAHGPLWDLWIGYCLSFGNWDLEFNQVG